MSDRFSQALGISQSGEKYFIFVYRGVFKILLNVYNGDFLQKI